MASHIDDGIYILLKEVIDNSIDEFIMHHGNRIVIQHDPETSLVSVRDYGRGIPLGKLIECVSQINTGAKYNDDVFQFSVGLNGVGLKLSMRFRAIFSSAAFVMEKRLRRVFSQGILQSKKRKKANEANGTYVEFIPDVEIFKKYHFQEEFIRKRFWHYAYLNTG